LLRDGKYDVLHDHQDYISGWHFMFGGRCLPGIRVTHVHNASHQILNNYGVSLRRRISSQLGKMLVRRYVTHIAGTSNQLIREYGFSEAMFGEVPKSAVYCGFDQSRFAGDRAEARQRLLEELGWPEDSCIILYAGRIDRSPDPDHPLTSKNSGFAVDVAIASALKEPRIRMILAGKPSDATPMLEARAQRAGVGDRIRFLGIRHDIEALMKASDLLLFPSRGEGLGMVAVEAQSAGLPVLMSTGVPEESIVVPELVTRKDLKDGVESWSGEVIHMAMRRKPVTLTEANRKVEASLFSLRNSATALRQLYTNGSLPESES
jgi:glycosyltransferase EpsF